MFRIPFICSALMFGSVCAEEEVIALGEVLSRTDAIPHESIEEATDHYLEGYIQALIDMHYYEFGVRVKVDGHTVHLSCLPKNDLIRNSIIAFVEDLPNVCEVVVCQSIDDAELEAQEQYMVKPQVGGVWFPQQTVLFQPLVAAPRQPMYYAEYRMGDNIMGTRSIGVALGDEFAIFRWHDVFPAHGDLQIGILAGIWFVFNMKSFPNGEFSELVNTDYLVGIPLSYAFDAWSFRMLIYHISSHLGDEFLVNRPNFLDKRVNPSFEAWELISSYQFTTGFRFYFGPGVILHSDNTFPMKTFYVKYGAELRMLGSRCHLYARIRVVQAPRHRPQAAHLCQIPRWLRRRAILQNENFLLCPRFLLGLLGRDYLFPHLSTLVNAPTIRYVTSTTSEHLYRMLVLPSLGY